MNYQRESVEQILSDILPLLARHHLEISEFKDIPLDPDFSRYFFLEKTNGIRIYTARTDERELAGYAIFYLNTHIHYRSALYASQDLLFIHPKFRGFGLSFLLWVDEQLKEEGAQLIYQTVTSRFDFSPLLKRIGYQESETIYIRKFS